MILRNWRLWWVVIWMVALATSVSATLAQEVVPGWDAPAILESWKVISAFALPLVMSAVIQSNWSRGVQALCTFAVSMLWTVIKYGIEGGFNNLADYDIIPTGMTIFALTIPFYYGLWKPTGLPQAIEAKTNLTPSARQAAQRKEAQARAAA